MKFRNCTLLLIIIAIGSFESHAQPWELIKKIGVPIVDQCSIDPSGNLYFSTQSGDIYKYDNTGKRLLDYSPQTQGQCSQIDAISALKVLVFYEEYQEYVMLDRYLSNEVRYRLASIDFGYVSHVSLTLLQSIWMVDASEFSLKLWNPISRVIEENKSLAKVMNEDKADITGLYTYQNRTYLVDRNSGIYVFDIIGNFMRFIEVSGLNSIGFHEGQLYYRKDNQLQILDLYKDNTVQLELPLNLGDKFIYWNDRLYHFTEKELEIYGYLSRD